MCEIINRMKKRIVECMKTANGFERDILKTVLGEVETIKSRTGKMDDAGVVKIFKKFKQGVEETMALMVAPIDTVESMLAEIVIYDQYIPKSLSLFATMSYLDNHKDALLGAKSDGQATGVAMGLLKRENLPVDGKDVALAVKALGVDPADIDPAVKEEVKALIQKLRS